MTLTELFDQYGSDKNAANGYGPIYDHLLGQRRDSIHSVLEIGVHQGASLRAWRDFFPQAEIVGIDIASPLVFAEERIVTLIANVTNAMSLCRALQERMFDLIVDDGSHELDEQVLALAHLWPHLRPGGLYVIEDILTEWSLRCLDFVGNAVVFDNQQASGKPGAVLMAIRKGKS